MMLSLSAHLGQMWATLSLTGGRLDSDETEAEELESDVEWVDEIDDEEDVVDLVEPNDLTGDHELSESPEQFVTQAIGFRRTD